MLIYFFTHTHTQLCLDYIMKFYYRNNVNYDEDVNYDLETLKPSAALYEEAKCLLQQVV